MNKFLLRKALQIIPPLDGSLHKGQSGRIGVVGGSKDYTGAPFFSGYAALRLGADLTHIICEPKASKVIKTYSPDIMVHSYLSSPKQDEKLYKSNQIEFENLLDRLHVVVIGPGLGRDQVNQSWAHWTISSCILKNIPLVLDADALWLLQSNPQVLNGYNKVILTPNIIEFERLLKSYSIKKEENNNKKTNKEEEIEKLAIELSKKLNSCTILLKSKKDIIVKFGYKSIKINSIGSPKRCGGQGDILTGLVATWTAWIKLYIELYKEERTTSELNLEKEGMLISASLGSELIRKTSFLTFNKLGRSIQSSDILNFIYLAFSNLFDQQHQHNNNDNDTHNDDEDNNNH